MLLRPRPADGYRFLADHAAGNPVTCASCGIGDVVILAAVDHHCGAVGMEDGIGLALSMVIAVSTSSTSSEPLGGMCKFGMSPV